MLDLAQYALLQRKLELTRIGVGMLLKDKNTDLACNESLHPIYGFTNK